MLHQLQWTSLEACRRQARLVLLYKISNNLVKMETRQFGTVEKESSLSGQIGTAFSFKQT
jgi:hypothetical protein